MNPVLKPVEELPWPASDEEMLALMAGDADALKMVRDIAFWSHVYDDLIDRDKPVSAEQIHMVMWKLLIALPMNPFYRAHETMIRPLVINGILNWHAANQIEQSGKLEELRIAHVIRHSIGDVGLLAMALAGGQDHAIANARRWKLLIQTGTWDYYCKEHCHDSQQA